MNPLKKAFIIYSVIIIGCTTYGQTTNVIYLNENEQQNVQLQVSNNPEVQEMHDSIVTQANLYLDDAPKPLDIIYYEGMLETDTARIRTRASLLDMDKISTFFYAYYGKPNNAYINKTKEFVLAWAKAYAPTGNTINENKFVPLLWGYYQFKEHFSPEEQKLVENWITEIGQKQFDRPSTPNNNWQAKRLRLLGLIGGITNNQKFIDYSLTHFRDYIKTAYFPDGTSNDLRRRDALHYHVSGLKPVITTSINLSTFDRRFNLFDYESPTGSSIKKSVEYMVPYATGEKVHEEWVNSQVALDKRRAAAGISEYQPGTLFDKMEAIPLFELAVYYNPVWFSILGKRRYYTISWISFLNSPLVRENNN